MKIIYFYVSDGAAGGDAKVTIDYAARTNNNYAINLPNEGMFQLFDQVAAGKTVDHAITIVESMRGGNGRLELTPHSTVYTVPRIEYALPLIEKDDIVVVRGGWKSWPPILQRIKNNGNWILFYRANTNRHPWPYWDVVLNDLVAQHTVVGGRLHFNFSKPINEDLFKPIYGLERTYDILLNGSHIHAKKGQYRFVQALAAYKQMYGVNLNVCLPGGFVRSWANEEMLKLIADNKLNVTCTGQVPREELNVLFNRSKFYVHIGTGGQNDRGALEAMRCGLPLLLSNPPAFSPFISNNPKITRVVPTTASPKEVAKAFFEMYSLQNTGYFEDVTAYYMKNNSMSIAVKKVEGLIHNLVTIGKVNREAINNIYIGKNNHEN